MPKKEVQDNHGPEPEDTEDEDKEFEKIIENLQKEELERSQSVNEPSLNDNINQEEIKLTTENTADIQEKKDITNTENSIEELSKNAEIEEIEDSAEIIETEAPNALDISEPAISDQEVEELDKIQDEVIKEKFADLPAHIEAILFEVGRPLKEPELVDILYEKYKADKNRIRWGLRKVMRALEAQNSAIQLVNPTKDFWSLQLHQNLNQKFIEKIEKFIPVEEFLSQKEITYITEIAYRQPVSTTEILRILGVDGYTYIRSLEEKGLISITKEGQSNVLRTTDKFAELFSFDSELRNLKIQLVWRLKKLAKSELVRDMETLKELKKDREKYEK